MAPSKNDIDFYFKIHILSALFSNPFLMKIVQIFVISIALCTLVSCVSGSNQKITPSSSQDRVQKDEFIPSPSMASGKMLLENIDSATFDYKRVQDETFSYLDSINLKYEGATFGALLKKYDKTVVYFYPKDGTPNCTIQALDFSMMQEKFNTMGYGILGVSQDDLDSHKLFAERNELKIPLIHDNSGSLLDAFGSRMTPQKYGNGDKLSDINRSTYVVDKDGNLLYAFRDVKAKGHARAVYKLLTNLDY